MKIAFVYYHKYPEIWRDGLWAALQILTQAHDVEMINLFSDSLPELKDYDFVLGWGAINSPADIAIHNAPIKKGLCIAGNVHLPNKNTEQYNVVFYETGWFSPYVQDLPLAIKAFGVNTDIYHPMSIPKVFDVLSVGAFADWKRQHMVTIEDGVRLVVGEIQEDNMDESMRIINDLNSLGVGTMDMVPPEKLAILYNMSTMVYIPADINGGGERAVWEAKVCGCDVKVENDNPKLKELLYSDPVGHIKYAEDLDRGIRLAVRRR
jgi:hypothetical protein